MAQNTQRNTSPAAAADARLERFQGGAGGAGSNAGPYADTQPYGGVGDQLGYGSGPEQGDSESAQHSAPRTGDGAADADAR